MNIGPDEEQILQLWSKDKSCIRATLAPLLPADALALIQRVGEHNLQLAAEAACILAAGRGGAAADLAAASYCWLAGDSRCDALFQSAVASGGRGSAEFYCEYLLENLRWHETLQLCNQYGIGGYIKGTAQLAADQPEEALIELSLAASEGDLRGGDTLYNLAVAMERAGCEGDIAAILRAARLHGCQLAQVELFVRGDTDDLASTALGAISRAGCCRVARRLVELGRLDEAGVAARLSGSSRLVGEIHEAGGEYDAARREYCQGARLGDEACLMALAERAAITLRPGIGRRLLAKAARSPGNGERAASAGLMSLNYDPAVSEKMHVAAHSRWGGSIQPLLRPQRSRPGERFTVGFISPDLGCHPVGYFLLPLLRNLDKKRFKVVIFSRSRRADWAQDELRTLADSWYDGDRLSASRLCQAVKDESVDLLIDTSGHSAGNLLAAVFAARPAPLQASWAGYVGTTGLPAMDAVFMDAEQLPPSSPMSETRIDLPGSYVCWAPYPYTPPVVTRPADGRTVFGSFNNIYKLNRPLLKLWAEVLNEVPDSVLLIRSHQADRPHVAAAIRACFSACGVAQKRVFTGGGLEHHDLLAAYGEVDICLDTYPYSGGLTTIEALWQGVPVVTLAGERFCSRHSLAHLTHCGLSGLVCSTPKEYVATCVRLAGDRPALAELRAGLRRRLLDSPILDGAAFARGFEDAVIRLAQLHEK